ncbi:MAG: YchJ family protein [Oligoflexia bacterium]|nr:YchJ family protein [Oligoflexia bacterium]
MKCPCGTTKSLSDCCEPFIKGTKKPLTAEALMRSRYTAYTQGELGYIAATLASESRPNFDEKDAREWSKNSKWLGLEILSTKKGQEADRVGTVEFNAKYENDGKVLEHHEVSEFRKEKDTWYFVDGESHVHEEGQGHHEPAQPVVRETPKIGRNDPCVCGSGKKYKKCCG